MEEQKTNENMSNEEKFKMLAKDMPANYKLIQENFDNINNHIDKVLNGEEEISANSIGLWASLMNVGAVNFVNAYLDLAKHMNKQIEGRDDIIDQQSDLIKEYRRLSERDKDLLDERRVIINKQSDIIEKLENELDNLKAKFYGDKEE